MPCILYMLWEVTSDMREVTFRQIRVYLLGYVEYFFVFGSHDKFFSFSTKILKTSETDGSPHKCVSPRGWYPERDLNPHDRNWPREFKSLVSTDSTIWATARHAAYDETTTPPRDKGTEKRDESLVVRDSLPSTSQVPSTFDRFALGELSATTEDLTGAVITLLII